MPTGVGTIYDMTTHQNESAEKYITRDGSYYSSGEVQTIMDLMDCDENKAQHICDLMDRYGYPDWSEDSDEDLREFFQFCLDTEKTYAKQD